MLGDELQREVDREPVGVVQQEGVLGGDPLRAGLPRPRDQLVQSLESLLERAAEAFLLGLEPLAHDVALGVQLGVLAAHQLGHDVGVAGQEAGRELECAAMLDGAAHDPPQHVAAILIGRDDAVGDQEGHRAAVIGEQTKRAIGRVILAVAPARELLAERDQRRELVGLEHRGLVLLDQRQPVQTEPGIDVLGRERRQRVHGVLVELHEDQIPVLEEALVVAARQVVGLAERHATVEVQLGARPARASRTGLPEVLRARALDDALARHADLEPRLDRLLVGSEPELVVAAEHRDPDVAGREAEALSRQLPGEARGLALEVVAEREVAEHLEERQMPGGRPDDVDVDRAERLLARGHTRVGRPLTALEVGLERVHPGDREQRGGVVFGGNQRGRGQTPVIALDEELEVGAADFVGAHAHGLRECRTEDAIGPGRAPPGVEVRALT